MVSQQQYYTQAPFYHQNALSQSASENYENYKMIIRLVTSGQENSESE
jgi:hypothetical protein